MRRLLATAVALSAIAAGLLARAQAAPVALVVAPYTSYLPGDEERFPARLEVQQGGSLLFANADYLGWHTLTSLEEDAEGRPLFTSDWIGLGETSWVHDVETLPVGDYPFYCTTHGVLMHGVLHVVA